MSHGPHAAAWVVLLHGMALPALSMARLAAGLRRDGYRVRSVHYPTRPYGIESLVARFVQPAVAACGCERPVHVVTHSLGGLLIRCYLQAAALPPGSRIVMLAPPNRGSEVADRLRHWPLYRGLFGAVGQQLGTGPDGIARRLRPIVGEIGVIAAKRSIQPWFSPLLPGENDGVVSVASARLAEMCDFMVVENSHTLMLLSGEVSRQVRHFLATGRFSRA